MLPSVLLHSGHSVTWSSWHLEPSVLGCVLIVVGLYVFAIASQPDEPVDWLRVCFFAAGVAVMTMALISPLDSAAHRLLSAHMLQHVLITAVGPPLVLLGVPEAALRRAVAALHLERILRYPTHPLVAASLFILNMWVWHIPAIYEVALTELPVHIVMHIAFMATGLLFWWPVVRPLPELSPLNEGGRLLYLFVTGFPMGILALLLLATPTVLYDYYETAPRLWGVSPLTDQQVAGMIMGSFGESASFIALSVLFFRFLDQEEPETAPPTPVDAR